LTHRVVSMLLLLGVMLAGCASLPTDPAPPKPVLSAVAVPPNVAAALDRLRSAYSKNDWRTVHQLIPAPALARRVIGEMQAWVNAGANDINVTPVYTKHVGAYRLVVTIVFSDDPRAWPSYLIALMNTKPDPAQIIGEPTGLTGTTIGTTTWTVTRAKNFILYHSPYQIAGSDRAYIASLEDERAAFARKFGVHLPPIAAYYLYPTIGLMGRLSNHACGSESGVVGCTTPFTTPPTIQTILWPTYHEPIHVYELALGPKPAAHEVWYAPLFVGEGTAVALEDRDVDPRLSDFCSFDLVYVPLDVCARTALKHLRPLSILRDKGFERADPGFAYSLAGSFAKYLILRYGYHRFGSFYHAIAARPSDRERDYDAATEKTYHRSIRALLAGWEHALT